MGQTVTFKRPDGGNCDGYLASPAGSGKAPGVVVIQEWWGVNDQIKGVAERMAAIGYRALEAKLRDGTVRYESYWYSAGHALFNQTGQNYNGECAKLAWERTAEFFARHLK